MPDLDEAIDRLLRIGAEWNVLEPIRPATDAEIASLQNLVAPLRIPADLEHLWRRLDRAPSRMVDRLDFVPVAQAIEFRKDHDWPAALLTIAYESHQFRFVELDAPDRTGGGAVWDSMYSDDDIREVAPSLADLLDAVATAWEDGIAWPYDVAGFHTTDWDHDAWEGMLAERWPARRRVSVEIVRWPSRWLEIQGIDAADAHPRGATATIAGLRTQGAGWTETATIDGIITGLVGTAEGSRVLFDDGTGQLVVFIPRGADTFQYARNGTRVELDLRPFSASVDVGPTFDPTGFDAVATAVRGEL